MYKLMFMRKAGIIMKTYIHKWGNRPGLHINIRIIVHSPKYRRDRMLKEITKKNLHYLIFEDKQWGDEEW